MYRPSVVTLLLVGVVALAGPAQDEAQKPTPPADKNGEKPLAPIKVSGTGDQASTKFQLQAGLSIWQITHEGRSNFQISLLRSDGKGEDMPINDIGRYKGMQAVHVANGGEYLLNVKADGKWTVTIDQPRPTSAPAKPLALTGKGPSVSPFVTLPQGINVFRVSHKGDGIFRVKVLNREGRVIEHVVAAIGTYEGSKAITIEEEGICLINISANGDWSLNID